MADTAGVRGGMEPGHAFPLHVVSLGEGREGGREGGKEGRRLWRSRSNRSQAFIARFFSFSCTHCRYLRRVRMLILLPFLP